MSAPCDPHQQADMIRIGYWISEKKSKKLDTECFTEFCRNAGVQLIKIDLEGHLEDQGPFDLIFHKLTDIMAKARSGNERAKAQIRRFQEYTAAHPDIPVVDPLHNLQKLMERNKQYQFVTQCEALEREYAYFMPSFVEFMSPDVETNKKLMEEYGVQFPFICKPSVAHGSSQCHQMAIIFNEAGLKDVEPPCVAQTFINHNAVLYKIFIIGKAHFIVPRPSLKNFSAGDHKTIHFDSAVVSKPYSNSFLNVLDEEDSACQMPPDRRCLEHLSHDLQSRLGLDLVGVDVIIENHTGRYAVIDVNAFPGYENGIDQLYARLLNVFLDKLNRPLLEVGSEDTNSETTTSIDTGVGTKESSDTSSSKSLDDFPSPVSNSDQYNNSSNKHDANCNLKKIDDKDDQVTFCNHRNCPVTTTIKQQNGDALIWDEIMTKESKRIVVEEEETKEKKDSYIRDWKVD